MAIKTPKAFKRRLETLTKRQGKVRDDIRALVGDAEELLRDNDEAAEALETALDALSRLA